MSGLLPKQSYQDDQVYIDREKNVRTMLSRCLGMGLIGGSMGCLIGGSLAGVTSAALYMHKVLPPDVLKKITEGVVKESGAVSEVLNASNNSSDLINNILKAKEAGKFQDVVVPDVPGLSQNVASTMNNAPIKVGVNVPKGNKTVHHNNVGHKVSANKHAGAANSKAPVVADDLKPNGPQLTNADVAPSANPGITDAAGAAPDAKVLDSKQILMLVAAAAVLLGIVYIAVQSKNKDVDPDSFMGKIGKLAASLMEKIGRGNAKI